MNKRSFIMYQEWATLIRGLPKDKAGELIQAICSYKLDAEYNIEDITVKAVFDMIKVQLDADADKYAEVCRKRAENGKKGGVAKANNNQQTLPNATKSKQMLANATKSKQKLADNDNDNDNDNNKKNKGTRTSDKLVFGEYKHVRLTVEQYDKLGVDLGESMRDACIKRLDEYIQERPDYKSKDHYLCIRRWVIKAVKEDMEKPTVKAKQTSFHQFDMKHNYDFDMMEDVLLRRQ